MAMSKNTIATPPGVTIKEQLEARGMSQKEFAERMDMSTKHISRLINGEVLLTTDMAIRLEMVLGMPAQFWCKLEAIYREKLARMLMERQMEAEIAEAKKFPYNEMVQHGWVPEASTVQEVIINLRKFFEVVDLEMVNGPLQPKIAGRRQRESEKADYALLAWAQKAKLEARNMATAKVNTEKLWKALPNIRAMTRTTPEIFCPQITKLLANCGVAIVFLPDFDGSCLNGATFRDKDKIVLAVTVQGKDADQFWFSLFHEIGHILLDHLSDNDGLAAEDEERANAFAKDVLISDDWHQDLEVKYVIS